MANLQVVKEGTVDAIQTKVMKMHEQGELNFPATYSPQNALKSAWLMLQEVRTMDKKLAIEVCDKTSIANALFDMVVQGLSPSKKQCYFIPYGKQLQLQRSYFGTKAVTLMLDRVKDITEQIIYTGDEVEISIKNGRKYVEKHIQKFTDIDINNIAGAYCTIHLANGDTYTEIMTLDQIKQAWKQSKMNPVDEKGNIKAHSTHGKFTDQMALKTVINRACKQFFNTSDDSAILAESFNRTTENEYLSDDEVKEQEVVEEVKEKANKETIDIDSAVDAEIIEDEPKKENNDDGDLDF